MTQVDEARLIPGKNGKKYLSLVFFDNKNGKDQYGNDGYVIQSLSKEEREAGKRTPIIGNFRLSSGPAPSRQSSERRPAPEQQSASDKNDDVPF